MENHLAPGIGYRSLRDSCFFLFASRRSFQGGFSDRKGHLCVELVGLTSLLKTFLLLHFALSSGLLSVFLFLSLSLYRSRCPSCAVPNSSSGDSEAEV